jgi:hypothetical protein
MLRGILLCALLLVPAALRADEGRCVSDCDCAPGFLCSSDGVCLEVACTQLHDPVCGLDGVTYPNDCEAEAVHVVVDHPGPCTETVGPGAAEGEVCGGFAGVTCQEGLICDLPPHLCISADVQGTCKEPPAFCPRHLDPVCGCDGVTYPNDCERLRAIAQLDHEGLCDEGCATNDDCTTREYCHFPEGRCGDRPGFCRSRPEVCLEVYEPVCGCDGQSYSNDCHAAAAGVSIAHQGECGG